MENKFYFGKDNYLGIGNPDPAIIFHGEGGEEIIKIQKGKFFWKGQEVEDVHQVYERFNDWLKIAESK